MLFMLALIAKNAVEEYENQLNIQWGDWGGGEEIVIYSTNV